MDDELFEVFEAFVVQFFDPTKQVLPVCGNKESRIFIARRRHVFVYFVYFVVSSRDCLISLAPQGLPR